MRKITSSTGVLIAGAGPPGLMMACQLAIRKIPFHIIDKNDRHMAGSGALVIHARTLEIFEQLGIAKRAIEQGILVKKINIVFNGSQYLSLSLRKMGNNLTRFPGLLLLEQEKTEQLLISVLESYHHKVERRTELTDFTNYSEGCTNILKLDGRQIVMKSKYLIAADGSHSMIRQQLRIPFPGQSYELPLFIFDGKAELNVPHDEICFAFTEKGSTGLFPLTGDRWRIDGTIPDNLDVKENIAFRDIAENFAVINKLKIKLAEPEWFSIFHSHQQYAGAFGYGRCFMIGDAAHVFSPIGAQGMNTGLQDACNLAWKIDMVMKGYADESLLDTYNNERQPLARKLVNSTDRLFQVITSNHAFHKNLRLRVAPLLLNKLFPWIEKNTKMAEYFYKGISEIAVHYRTSPLSTFASYGTMHPRAPKPGDRLPYIRFKFPGKEVNIQDLASHDRFHLFLFSKDVFPDLFLDFLLKYEPWLSWEFIQYDYGTAVLYHRLGMRNKGFYLIRPDMYIACRSTNLNPQQLESYFKRIIKSPETQDIASQA